MKSDETAYLCAVCDSEFVDIWYNHYDFSRENKYVTCPNCGTKLVMDYDFDLSTKITDYASNVFNISVLLAVMTSMIWGFQKVGFYVVMIGCGIGIPLFLAADNLRNAEVQKIKSTRKYRD